MMRSPPSPSSRRTSSPGTPPPPAAAGRRKASTGSSRATTPALPPPSCNFRYAGAYLLVVISDGCGQLRRHAAQPWSEQQFVAQVIQQVRKGLSTCPLVSAVGQQQHHIKWQDLADLESYLVHSLPMATAAAAAGTVDAEHQNEVLLQYARESVALEVLWNPGLLTLTQCLRHVLRSPTGAVHLVYAGATFQETGSWVLADGPFSAYNLYELVEQQEPVELAVAPVEPCRGHGSIAEHLSSHDVHLQVVHHAGSAGQPEWSALRDLFSQHHVEMSGPMTTSFILKHGRGGTNRPRFLFQFALNPESPDHSVELTPAAEALAAHLEKTLTAHYRHIGAEPMAPSPAVGFIRLQRPTVYVFPAGQGDSALLALDTGFTMLLDAGYLPGHRSFWPFVRHLHRLDSVVVTHLGEDNLFGILSLADQRLAAGDDGGYPRIGYLFCNDHLATGSRAESADPDPTGLRISLAALSRSLFERLARTHVEPLSCIRNLDSLQAKPSASAPRRSRTAPSATTPITLYHKAGAGTLYMYVLNPTLEAMMPNDSTAGPGAGQEPPEADQQSICSLLIWRPHEPAGQIVRMLIPGNCTQRQILEGLEALMVISKFDQAPVQAGGGNERVARRFMPTRRQQAGSDPPCQDASLAEQLELDLLLHQPSWCTGEQLEQQLRARSAAATTSLHRLGRSLSVAPSLIRKAQQQQTPAGGRSGRRSVTPSRYSRFRSVSPPTPPMPGTSSSNRAKREVPRNRATPSREPQPRATAPNIVTYKPAVRSNQMPPVSATVTRLPPLPPGQHRPAAAQAAASRVSRRVMEIERKKGPEPPRPVARPKPATERPPAPDPVSEDTSIRSSTDEEVRRITRRMEADAEVRGETTPTGTVTSGSATPTATETDLDQLDSLASTDVEPEHREEKQPTISCQSVQPEQPEPSATLTTTAVIAANVHGRIDDFSSKASAAKQPARTESDSPPDSETLTIKGEPLKLDTAQPTQAEPQDQMSNPEPELTAQQTHLKLVPAHGADQEKPEELEEMTTQPDVSDEPSRKQFDQEPSAAVIAELATEATAMVPSKPEEPDVVQGLEPSEPAEPANETSQTVETVSVKSNPEKKTLELASTKDLVPEAPETSTDVKLPQALLETPAAESLTKHSELVEPVKPISVESNTTSFPPEPEESKPESESARQLEAKVSEIPAVEVKPAAEPISEINSQTVEPVPVESEPEKKEATTLLPPFKLQEPETPTAKPESLKAADEETEKLMESDAEKHDETSETTPAVEALMKLESVESATEAETKSVPSKLESEHELEVDVPETPTVKSEPASEATSQTVESVPVESDPEKREPVEPKRSPESEPYEAQELISGELETASVSSELEESVKPESTQEFEPETPETPTSESFMKQSEPEPIKPTEKEKVPDAEKHDETPEIAPAAEESLVKQSEPEPATKAADEPISVESETEFVPYKPEELPQSESAQELKAKVPEISAVEVKPAAAPVSEITSQTVEPVLVESEPEKKEATTLKPEELESTEESVKPGASETLTPEESLMKPSEPTSKATDVLISKEPETASVPSKLEKLVEEKSRQELEPETTKTLVAESLMKQSEPESVNPAETESGKSVAPDAGKHDETTLSEQEPELEVKTPEIPVVETKPAAEPAVSEINSQTVELIPVKSETEFVLSKPEESPQSESLQELEAKAPEIPALEEKPASAPVSQITNQQTVEPVPVEFEEVTTLLSPSKLEQQLEPETPAAEFLMKQSETESVKPVDEEPEKLVPTDAEKHDEEIFAPSKLELELESPEPERVHEASLELAEPTTKEIEEPLAVEEKRSTVLAPEIPVEPGEPAAVELDNETISQNVEQVPLESDPEKKTTTTRSRLEEEPEEKSESAKELVEPETLQAAEHLMKKSEPGKPDETVVAPSKPSEESPEPERVHEFEADLRFQPTPDSLGVEPLMEQSKPKLEIEESSAVEKKEATMAVAPDLVKELTELETTARELKTNVPETPVVEAAEPATKARNEDRELVSKGKLPEPMPETVEPSSETTSQTVGPMPAKNEPAEQKKTQESEGDEAHDDELTSGEPETASVPSKLEILPEPEPEPEKVGGASETISHAVEPVPMESEPEKKETATLLPPLKPVKLESTKESVELEASEAPAAEPLMEQLESEPVKPAPEKPDAEKHDETPETTPAAEESLVKQSEPASVEPETTFVLSKPEELPQPEPESVQEFEANEPEIAAASQTIEPVSEESEPNKKEPTAILPPSKLEQESEPETPANEPLETEKLVAADAEKHDKTTVAAEELALVDPEFVEPKPAFVPSKFQESREPKSVPELKGKVSEISVVEGEPAAEPAVSEATSPSVESDREKKEATALLPPSKLEEQPAVLDLLSQSAAPQLSTTEAFTSGPPENQSEPEHAGQATERTVEPVTAELDLKNPGVPLKSQEPSMPKHSLPETIAVERKETTELLASKLEEPDLETGPILPETPGSAEPVDPEITGQTYQSEPETTTAASVESENQDVKVSTPTMELVEQAAVEDTSTPNESKPNDLEESSLQVDKVKAEQSSLQQPTQQTDQTAHLPGPEPAESSGPEPRETGNEIPEPVKKGEPAEPVIPQVPKPMEPEPAEDSDLQVPKSEPVAAPSENKSISEHDSRLLKPDVENGEPEAAKPAPVESTEQENEQNKLAEAAVESVPPASQTKAPGASAAASAAQPEPAKQPEPSTAEEIKQPQEAAEHAELQKSHGQSSAKPKAEEAEPDTGIIIESDPNKQSESKPSKNAEISPQPKLGSAEPESLPVSNEPGKPVQASSPHEPTDNEVEPATAEQTQEPSEASKLPEFADKQVKSESKQSEPEQSEEMLPREAEPGKPDEPELPAKLEPESSTLVSEKVSERAKNADPLPAAAAATVEPISDGNQSQATEPSDATVDQLQPESIVEGETDPGGPEPAIQQSNEASVPAAQPEFGTAALKKPSESSLLELCTSNSKLPADHKPEPASLVPEETLDERATVAERQLQEPPAEISNSDTSEAVQNEPLTSVIEAKPVRPINQAEPEPEIQLQTRLESRSAEPVTESETGKPSEAFMAETAVLEPESAATSVSATTEEESAGTEVAAEQMPEPDRQIGQVEAAVNRPAVNGELNQPRLKEDNKAERQHSELQKPLAQTSAGPTDDDQMAVARLITERVTNIALGVVQLQSGPDLAGWQDEQQQQETSASETIQTLQQQCHHVMGETRALLRDMDQKLDQVRMQQMATAESLSHSSPDSVLSNIGDKSKSRSEYFGCGATTTQPEPEFECGVPDKSQSELALDDARSKLFQSGRLDKAQSQSDLTIEPSAFGGESGLQYKSHPAMAEPELLEQGIETVELDYEPPSRRSQSNLELYYEVLPGGDMAICLETSSQSTIAQEEAQGPGPRQHVLELLLGPGQTTAEQVVSTRTVFEYSTEPEPLVLMPDTAGPDGNNNLMSPPGQGPAAKSRHISSGQTQFDEPPPEHQSCHDESTGAAEQPTPSELPNVIYASMASASDARAKRFDASRDWDEPMALPSPTGPSRTAVRAPVNPVYVEMAYLPGHGQQGYCDVDFFRKIRARYYVLSGVTPSRQVLDALLEAVAKWNPPAAHPTTIVPTYESEALARWYADNQDRLAELGIQLAPAAAKCQISLLNDCWQHRQHHQPNEKQNPEDCCFAYKIELGAPQ